MFVIAHAADLLYIAPLALIILLLIFRRGDRRPDAPDKRNDKR